MVPPFAVEPFVAAAAAEVARAPRLAGLFFLSWLSPSAPRGWCSAAAAAVAVEDGARPPFLLTLPLREDEKEEEGGKECLVDVGPPFSSVVA